uniref:BHLH domain-containing protein n=1 Tax=Leptobrachium leishanense TaxID=445787 RepID=A0A8C5M763_9ANUR
MLSLPIIASSNTPSSSTECYNLSPAYGHPAIPLETLSNYFQDQTCTITSQKFNESSLSSRRTRCRVIGPQRQSASEREKMRMRDLSKALHNLRRYLPPSFVPPGRNLTKIETLRMTIHYISYLSQLLGKNEETLNPRREAKPDMNVHNQYLEMVEGYQGTTCRHHQQVQHQQHCPLMPETIYHRAEARISPVKYEQMSREVETNGVWLPQTACQPRQTAAPDVRHTSPHCSMLAHLHQGEDYGSAELQTTISQPLRQFHNHLRTPDLPMTFLNRL